MMLTSMMLIVNLVNNTYDDATRIRIVSHTTINEIKKQEEKLKQEQIAEEKLKKEEQTTKEQPIKQEITTTQTQKLYTLNQFMFNGVVNWGGYKFTYYSQSVLPGGGLVIPGRHVNADGYVSDIDGYIVLAGDAPKGTIYPTPFGYYGKIYDRGTSGNHLDVYIR